MLDVQAPARLKLKLHWSGPESQQSMSDDPTDDADRLEEALERIARLANRPPPAAAAPENAELAARLDSLITQLRATLAGDGA